VDFGPQLHNADSLRAIEINMDSSNLMKTKVYAASNLGRASEIGWLMATPARRQLERRLQRGGSSNSGEVWFLGLWCIVFSED
jgi:hypothetical protein